MEGFFGSLDIVVDTVMLNTGGDYLTSKHSKITLRNGW